MVITDNISNPSIINTHSILVRLGVSKSQIRKWLFLGCIFKEPPSKKLYVDDNFSTTAIKIRTAFLIDAEPERLPNIAECLNAKLGKNDSFLLKILEEHKYSYEDIINKISNDYNLNISWRKFLFF